jgi:hypothetical protein
MGWDLASMHRSSGLKGSDPGFRDHGSGVRAWCEGLRVLGIGSRV